MKIFTHKTILLALIRRQIYFLRSIFFFIFFHWLFYRLAGHEHCIRRITDCHLIVSRSLYFVFIVVAYCVVTWLGAATHGQCIIILASATVFTLELIAATYELTWILLLNRVQVHGSKAVALHS